MKPALAQRRGHRVRRPEHAEVAGVGVRTGLVGPQPVIQPRDVISCPDHIELAEKLKEVVWSPRVFGLRGAWSALLLLLLLLLRESASALRLPLSTSIDVSCEDGFCGGMLFQMALKKVLLVLVRFGSDR
eukprot:1319961-Rhodomonas_salina.2